MKMLISVLAVIWTTQMSAQESAYRTVEVSGKISISIPAHWHIRDLDERQNIAASSEAIAGSPVSVSSLSVVSRPEPVGVIVRITFMPLQLSQKDVNDAISNDRAGFLAELHSTFNQDLDSLRDGFEKQGISVLGEASASIESVGGLTALAMRYRRTSPIGQSPFTVTQYHIPLGNEKAIITFSYRESDERLFLPVVEHMKKSVAFIKAK